MKTKAQKIQEFDQLSLERDRYMLAMHDAINGDICWSKWAKDPYSEGKYRVGTCRLEAADGGIALIAFRYPQQTDYVTVYAADGFKGLNPAISQCYFESRHRSYDS